MMVKESVLFFKFVGYVDWLQIVNACMPMWLFFFGVGGCN